MENRREEIKGLKRLLVGVIVSTLLITMLPFENMGTFVVKGADTNTGTKVFSEIGINFDTATPILIAAEETDAGIVTAEEVFINTLNSYNATDYPNGMLLQLTCDLNLSTSKTIPFFAGKIGIYLNGYSITGITPEYITVNKPAAMPETGYANQLVIVGGTDSTNSINSTLSFEGNVVNGVEQLATWDIQQGCQVIFSQVNLDNVDIIANAGSAIGDDGWRYEVPAADTTSEFLCYRQEEGRSIYQQEITSDQETIMYLTGLELNEGVTSFDISKPYFENTSKIVFDESVVTLLPEKVSYYNSKYTAEYTSPTVPFVTDQTYGMYSVSEDGTTLTLYSLWKDGNKINFKTMDTDSTTEPISVSLNINCTYLKSEVVDGTVVESTYDKVILAEGAIPAGYTLWEWSDSAGEFKDVSYKVKQVLFADQPRQELTDFEFDLTNCQGIEIFNRSGSEISIIDNDTEEIDTNNGLWVALEIFLSDYYTVEGMITHETGDGNSGALVEAGSVITLIPSEGYTLYNVQLGNYTPYTTDFGTMYSYDGVRNPSLTNVKYCVDGSIVVTVPKHAGRFEVSTGEIESIELVNDAQTPSDYVTFNGDRSYFETSEAGPTIDWYGEAVTLTANESKEFVTTDTGSIRNAYQIVDTAEGTEWGSSLTFSEEGVNQEKVLYIMDQSYEKDIYDRDGDSDTEETYPSSTYGKITELTYNYTIDKESPIITEVIGSYRNEDGSITEFDVTKQEWINKDFITLTVFADNGENGTSFNGFAYSTTNDVNALEWIENSELTGTTQIEGDGEHQLYIFARDEFDKNANRTVVLGKEIAIGLDGTVPYITYTDATVTAATELKSDSTYTGNLYMTMNDETSGFASVTLEKYNGDSLEADLLSNGTVAGVYYIAPEEKDVKYRITLEDVAGNVAVYDNVTVAGYEQDIEVEIGNTTGTYNEELQIELIIMNNSENEVTGLTYQSVAEATDSVFNEIAGTVERIAAGESTIFMITLPAGVNVGAYTAMLDFAYTSDGGRVENTISKKYNYQVDATISRMEVTEDMYTISAPEDKESGWYKDGATITAAEGYTLSTTEDGTYSQTLTINQTTYNYTFYVKRDTGAISDAVVIDSIKVDNSGPSITYTDAVTSTMTTLVGNASYEGNLYLTIQDAGIGFESISLYRYENNTWVGAAVALKNTDTIGVYYIVPQATDAVYKIEVKDTFGNVTTYENVTVKAYTPDVEITTDMDSVEYGVEGLITITIKNTGSVEITNVVYKLNEPEVQNVFESLEGTIDSIAAGATATITVATLPNNNLGTYVAPLELTYTSNGATKEAIINKACSQDIAITIVQAEGSGEITIQDMFYYGEEITYDVASDTNGVSNVKVYFRDADSATAEFSETVPTAEGNYEVKAVFAATAEYTEATAEGTFTITRMQATEDMYGIAPSDREDGWYKDSIVINGSEGNLLSTTEDGEYTESLTITTEVESFSFYIKTPTGAITQEVTLSNLLIDLTTPIVFVNDEELVSGSTYDQTIQLFIEDAGVGIADITIQGNAESIVETEDGSYYILQAAQDQTYTIVGTDDLGNAVTYSNITVKAYTQDVEITATNNTAIYGSTEDVIIHIKNTGSTTLSNINYTIETSETDNVFSPQSEAIDVIDPGETVTIALTLTGKADAGEYLASIKVNYTANGEIVDTNIDKVYTQEFSVTVTQAEGTGTVEIQDYYYGEEVSLLVNSDTNGNESYTVYYKNAEDETAEFTQNVPTEAGKYIVRVVFAATTNYKEVIAENTFNIYRLAPTKDMYIYGTETNDTGWILSDVIITAQDGYTISVTEDGTFTDTLTISETVESYSFYVKTETGAVTEAVVLGTFQIDKTAPEIAENEGIYVVKTWWQKFLEVITFNIYQSETEQIEIKAHDNESGMAQISYYVSTDAISMEDISAIEDWTEGTELTINRGDYEQFVVYAKLENNAGLVTYLSTDGIIMEAVPVEPETSVEPETPVEPETSVEPEPPVEGPEETVVHIGAGKVTLEKGTPYQLKEGTWMVAGDTTEYAGGITFYVDEDGEYEFIKK